MKLVRRPASTSLLSPRLPGDLWNWFDNMFTTSMGTGLVPALDVEETDKNVVVRAELPGVEAKNVELFIRDNVLTIQGEKSQEEETKEHDYIRSERRYGSFRREIALPAEVDAAKVEAKYHNGVLTITVPKTAEREAKRIEIKPE